MQYTQSTRCRFGQWY